MSDHNFRVATVNAAVTFVTALRKMAANPGLAVHCADETHTFAIHFADIAGRVCRQ